MPSEFETLLSQLEENDEGGSSEAFKQLRDHAKSLEKDLSAEKKQRSNFEARVTELEQAQKAGSIQSLFQTLGIKPELAELFLTAHQGDVTEETAKEWANKYGFLQSQESQETETEKPEPPEGNRPVVGTESTTKLMPLKEFNALLKTSPARAMQLAQDGLVEGMEHSKTFGEAGAVAAF